MSHAPAVELAPAVYRIPTMAGDLVNAFALSDDDGQITLVDCGYRIAHRRILAALRWIGAGPSDVTRILLTHAHSDHTGGLARLRGRTGAPVSVHQADAAYVRAGRHPVMDRSTLVGRVANRLPWGRFAPVEVSEELIDGQVLPIAGGLSVVHTPGHTPGHVSLLHRDSAVLLVGDALFHFRRRVSWPFAGFCTDSETARKSAARLCDLDFEIAAFAHGPEIRGNAREAVRAFVRREGARR